MEFTRKHFDPPPAPAKHRSPAAITSRSTADDGAPVYLHSERIVLAVNVAIAAKRPLLISGPPGSGKSTLARYVAWVKQWRYLKQVVTSRTAAEDLLYRVDALQRLNDAQLKDRTLLPDFAYIDPGVLWWAFDRESAARRGGSVADVAALGERFPKTSRQVENVDTDDVVVLLDEIDKAEPDVPNDLLEPLDRGSFAVRGIASEVTRRGEVLLIITTNGERELPPAFYRRCVVLSLEEISGDEKIAQLTRIAALHFGSTHVALHNEIAAWFVSAADHARRNARREPSTAEYLDTVWACAELAGTGAPAAVWTQVAELALWKHDERFDVALPTDTDRNMTRA